nr:ribonuclease H-like domain-containing protein [Tanacetum cinerariifolium]
MELLKKNKTLIEVARIMLADSFLPTTFWAEAVNLNRVLVTKPQNKIPYELLTGRQPIISYLRPFEYHVTILNTIDQLGKFDGKSDLDSMNYEPISLENQTNKSAGSQEANNSAGTQANADQGANSEEIDLHDEHFVLPIWSAYSTTVKSSKDKIQKITDCKTSEKPAISAVGPSKALNDVEPSYPDNPLMPHLEDNYASPSARIFTNSSYDDEGVVTDFNNSKTTVNVSPTHTIRIHTIHLKTQILKDPLSAVQTRSKAISKVVLAFLSLSLATTSSVIIG